MDRDDLSSSRNLFHYPCHHRRRHHTAYTQTRKFSYPHHYHDFDITSPNCSSDLLMECANAVHVGDMPRAQHCMWMLNEIASSCGDTDQKLAFYFLQALFSRVTSSGNSCRTTLQLASDKAMSFDVARWTALRFQEASPWPTFGHVASNAAILEGLDGEQRIHIIDVSNTFCTQWPTFLEALASRSSDETPHLRLTTVVASVAPSPAVQKVMKEIGARMEKFARLMCVPFKFQCVHHGGDLSSFEFDALGMESSEAVAINCVNSMHGVPTSSLRDTVAEKFRRINPRVITLVEEEADMNAEDGEVQFLKSFQASLSFFATYLDSLGKCFSKTSKERLALEKTAGRAIMDLVACSPEESGERRETGSRWSNRMRTAGFEPVALSEDGTDDVNALLRRYREGWSVVHYADVDPSTAGISLAWKEQAVVWTCAWKPKATNKMGGCL